MAFLRELFGPSKDEIWRQLCDQVGGEFVAGRFWTGSKVQVQHKQWTVTLDTFTESHGEHGSRTYTRMRAPYVNKDGFRFTVYRRGFFSDLGKLFGMQDVEIGEPEFDDAFIIKGNDEEKLRKLFADPRVRQLFERQPKIHLSVRDDEGWFQARFPEGVDELYFREPGVIKDLDRLKALYDLFAEVLDRLCRIGSAYDDDPGVAL
ncbi:MAG TPA: hypothetical protein VG826_13390 [Pirellulales bacterium]|nr:hypothetical protein [Pirellulales bacterium]